MFSTENVMAVVWTNPTSAQKRVARPTIDQKRFGFWVVELGVSDLVGDARHLSPSAQEALRLRAVAALVRRPPLRTQGTSSAPSDL
ncbi:hypothetical protein [Streptomyces sp. ICC4]|uniref:hypothetical protein n=1 Tax=Streptomyces sp. ICC4 TaxID=2099584 RepID=UPI001EF77C08|nr:hypothetical protein [Streptomyces sp. ICC4]